MAHTVVAYNALAHIVVAQKIMQYDGENTPSQNGQCQITNGLSTVCTITLVCVCVYMCVYVCAFKRELRREGGRIMGGEPTPTLTHPHTRTDCS